MRFNDVRILTPRITPIEAQVSVLANWTDPEGTASLAVLKGRVIGPFCEYAKTLTDRIPLTSKTESQSVQRCELQAFARVLEPCFWDPQHPFCYEMSIELHHAERIADMRQVFFGIRHLAVDNLDLLLNGQPLFVQGVKHFTNCSIAELEAWHDSGCNAFLCDASDDLYDRTDHWGPMVFQVLVPGHHGDVTALIRRTRNRPSLLMWVLPPGISGESLTIMVELIREHDPSRRIGRLVSMVESTRTFDSVDVLLLPAGHPAISDPVLQKPFIVVGTTPSETPGCTPDTFDTELGTFRESIESRAGFAGVIL